MAWLGWRVIAQEEIVATQRAQEQLEQSADRLVALSRGRIAELNQQLNQWMVDPPRNAQIDDGMLVVQDGVAIAPFPPSRLLYRPDPPRDPEAPPALFAAAEALEFRGEFEAAGAGYRAFTGSTSSSVRAGALLRLARTYRKAGRKPEAIAAYQQLTTISAAGFANLPAGLLAIHALSELRGNAADNQAFSDGLREARWTLDRGQFLFYWSEAKRLAGPVAQPAALGLTEAAYNTLIRWRYEWPAEGDEILRVGKHPYLLVWKRGVSRSGMLVMDLEALLRQLARGESYSWAMTDRQGVGLAGQREGAGRTHVRVAADTGLPWTVYTGAPPDTLGNAARIGLFRFGLVLMLLLLALGSWFTVRAMRREMETARQQSAFVAAVSHEFRSPLTSLRHLSDMLVLGRVTEEGRRHQYYEALAGETARLQTLVESLLNFGRMEAGSQNYSHERVDVAELVRSTVATFESAIARKRISATGTPDCRLNGDPAALGVAVRNLVDNALKYSAGPVRVEWESSDARVMIRVTDQGEGVLPSELKTVFERFVRGSAAAARNVTGTGLGLAMVRHIAAAHGGEARVDSVAGGGCVFTLVFPGAGPA